MKHVNSDEQQMKCDAGLCGLFNGMKNNVIIK